MKLALVEIWKLLESRAKAENRIQNNFCITHFLTKRFL